MTTTEWAGGHLATLAGLTGGRDELEGEIGVLGPSSAVDAVVNWDGPALSSSLREAGVPVELAP